MGDWLQGSRPKERGGKIRALRGEIKKSVTENGKASPGYASCAETTCEGPFSAPRGFFPVCEEKEDISLQNVEGSEKIRFLRF